MNMMRRIRIVALALVYAMLSTAWLGFAETAPAIIDFADAVLLHQPDQHIGDADTALALLLAGNHRYTSGDLSAKGEYAQAREILKEAQFPFAVVLTCSDSRVAPEIYFDQAMGDIFVIRNAGNIVDSSALGSIEYAVEHLEVPLVVVVGHSRCGAVTAALAGGEQPANLRTILDQIVPACEGVADLNAAIDNHIAGMVTIVQNNEIVQACKARVIGMCYSIEDGVVALTTQPK